MKVFAARFVRPVAGRGPQVDPPRALRYGPGMQASALQRGSRAAFTVAAAVLLLIVALLAAAVAPCAARAATVARGIADPTLTQPGPRIVQEVQSEAITQMGPDHLQASYVRFVLSWADAEPDQDGVYDSTYLEGVTRAIDLANDEGLKVIVTFAYVPMWASNPAFWDTSAYPNVHGYDRRYAMKTDAATLAGFRRFCKHIAGMYRGKVFGYECWNEPNLHLTLYPQATAKDRYYGAHEYIKMLRAFSPGIHAGDPAAVRIAGATAPRGKTPAYPLSGRRMMTSPQLFAAQIKAARVSSLFDAYSHHPYTPAASPQMWPEAPPRDTTTTVNLQNLGVLLAMFPTKPFYLTEFGYQTAPCNSFSQQYVDPPTQADYLRRAYAYVARYKQVKLLMWFLLDDYSPSGIDPLDGVYTGLREITGAKKPSWYVFAQGNELTLQAPAMVTPGATLTLTGTLNSTCDGLLQGKLVQIQSRVPRGAWTDVGPAVQTDALGAYTLTITAPSEPTSYRAVWPSVVTSDVSLVGVN
jgi:hypothetical protein